MHALARALIKAVSPVLPRALQERIYRRRLRNYADQVCGSQHHIDWIQRARTASKEEWIREYDDTWKLAALHDDCLPTEDVELVLAHVSGTSVLEVGCGQGTLLLGLLRAGFEAAGVDVSSEALRLTRRDVEKAGLVAELRQGFVEDLPFPDRSFDTVTCCHVLEHVSDVDVALADLARVARRRLVLIVPSERRPDFEYNISQHVQFFPRLEDFTDYLHFPRYSAHMIAGSAASSAAGTGKADVITHVGPRIFCVIDLDTGRSAAAARS